MKYTLVITEKPDAAKRIADALAEGKPIRETINQVPYYKITREKKDLVIACAVGHLYGLDEKKKSWDFPVFDIEWQPTHETRKTAAFSKKYLQAIKNLCKEANEFIVATDLDTEGEVIGLNIIRFACKQKDAERMRFSTLTKPDLIEAYEDRTKTIDWGLANAGEARHYLDYYNGISYSRALTHAIKQAGAFKIMSTGRVQGPALKIIVDREKEIKVFKPVPFWQIQLLGNVKKQDIEAWHKEDKFWDKKQADKVMKNVKGQKKGIVDKVEKKQFQQSPPFPFDLTTLQIEAYRCHGIQPKDTLSIAQDLYTSGCISYPRTSSQQLPPKIGYNRIITALSKQTSYSNLCSNLLKKQLTPNNGRKTDPAHPAIYPTGIIPKIDQRALKIYDLIVRRFLATFAEPALRETMAIDINVNKEIFIAKGTRTIKRGWHVYYGPYVKLEEIELPPVVKGDIVDIKKITLQNKETTPPRRYTPASIIKELEKRNLGTKATRASIVDTLFQRGYVHGKAIEATEFGIKTIETLEKHAPKIIDEALTRHFEGEMEEIRENKKKKEEVLEEAKKALTSIIADFKKEEKAVGKELLSAFRETRHIMTTLGNCPNCKKGELQIRKGKFGSFAACNKYPKCKTTFSLPNNAIIKPSKNVCETCKMPMVLAIKSRKRPTEFCLNPQCKSKHVEGKAGKQAKAIAKGEIKRKCPKCKEGNIVLRKSIYGAFYACDRYPKCKYTESLTDNKKEVSSR